MEKCWFSQPPPLKVYGLYTRENVGIMDGSLRNSHTHDIVHWGKCAKMVGQGAL